MNPESIRSDAPSAPVAIVDDAEGIRETQIQAPFADHFTYSNIAAFSTSLMDIRISFGEFLPDGTSVPRVGVVMSPEQAAVLAMLLLSQVNSYEQSFGKIRDPRWRYFADTAAEKAAKALQEGKLGSSEKPT